MNIALKEWNLLGEALLSARQAILLRKGGILEANNEFELEHRRFLLFPTFVHQDVKMLKPQWRAGVTNVRDEPERVTLKGFAEVVRVWEVPSRAAMDELFDLHMWDTPLVDMRFAYRPEKPLYLVVVRGWRLREAVELANTAEYAGCKSWVTLEESVDTTGAVAAMEEGKLAGIVERVGQTFQSKK